MKWIKTIYKFMPFRPEFVDNRFLRITPRVDLNDPYDYHPFESDIEDIKELYKSCGNTNISDKQSVDSYLNGLGVISFTESIDNILMWSHYADGHKGIAVGFDPEHDFFKELERVRYTTQRPDLRKEFPKILDPVLLFKSDQWIYEKEWRLVKSFNKAKKVLNAETGTHSKEIPVPCSYPYLAMLKVPKKAIQSITFGVNVENGNIDTIKNKILSNNSLSHIKLQKIELCMNKYELNIIEI